MIKVEVSVEIACAPETAFAYISNFENNPKWQSGMVKATVTSPAPLGVGTTYSQLAKFLGRQIESTFEVIAFEPQRMVKAASTSGSFPITFTRIVEPQQGGALVKAIVEGEAAGFFRLAEPLLRSMVRKSVEGDYQQLKQMLEDDSRSAS